MKFKKLSEGLPTFGEEVLIRYKDYWSNGYKYYVCCLGYKSLTDNTLIFEEAGGEQYSYWEFEDVDGWMYASDLDNID